MMQIIKTPLIFLFILFVFSCTAQEKGNYFSLLPKKEEMATLPIDLNFNKEKRTQFSSLEKLYLVSDFDQIIKKGFHKNLSEQDQYIYFRSLEEEQKWNLLVQNIPLSSYLYSPFLGAYFNFMLIKAYLNLNRIEDAYTSYKKVAALFQNVPKELLNPTINTLAAKKQDPSIATSLGDYYYSLYVENHQIAFFKKALNLKNPSAIGALHKGDFAGFIGKSNYVSFLDSLKQYNFPIYIEMLKLLNKQEVIASYYFNKEKYATALHYAVSGSFISHMTHLVVEGKATPEDIAYANNHLKESVFYLGTYYYNHQSYTNIARILKNAYHFGVIRYLVLSGFQKTNHATLLNDLLEIQNRWGNDFTLYDKMLSSYWLGYLYQKKGDIANAYKIWINNASYYPCSFYGFESYKNLGGNQIQQVIANWKTIQSNTQINVNQYINHVNTTLLPNNMEMKRAIFFMSIRDDKLGFIYIHNLFQGTSFPKSYYSIALARIFYSINRMDYYYSYIKLFANTIDDISKANLFYGNLLPLIFPLQYKKEIEKASQKFKFDPSILESLILKESAYDLQAISWVGAQGLSQLMPSTAKPIFNTLYKKNIIHNKDIFDPQTNVMLGGYYLNWLYYGYYKDFPSNYRLALSYASYNAGPGRIKKMFTSLNNKENVVHFIESISLTESRNYVKQLTLYNDMYRFIYY